MIELFYLDYLHSWPWTQAHADMQLEKSDIDSRESKQKHNVKIRVWRVLEIENMYMEELNLMSSSPNCTTIA